MAKHECPLCGDDYDTRYDLCCSCYLDYASVEAWQIALAFCLREEDKYWRSRSAESEKEEWLNGCAVEWLNNRAPAPL